ncbi:28S ribosomal protein S22, mitochondrial [Nematolebias whitei]|uniref:28S ribosomal protein S22, mitochondrial n=1 Tax=Nematolebias whitei TaxID=451745 RepID=UPI0018978976|nr:28S ribosomal protein S22, mitochondrial [Nematolebias whitei]
MAALGSARYLFRSFSWVKNVHRNKHTLMKCSVRTFCDETHEKDHKAQFTDPAVQDILTRITGLDMQKVFQSTPDNPKPPIYKLMTDEQLMQAVQQASEEAKRQLQMPPVLPERKPINDVLAVDKILDGMDTAKYAFTDITYNVPHRERFIVVREPGGTLRKASWEERDRLVQVYFPKEGRKIFLPLIFKEEHLKVHVAAYEDLDKTNRYHLLQFTRHFGGMVWYLINARRMDGLLVNTLKKGLLQDAVSLVSLFHMVHPHSESAQEAASQQATGTDLLKIYAETESQMSAFIKLALQAYEERTAEESAA